MKITMVIFIFTVFFATHCSVVIPPITFTGSKTATEKQIIGEESELEEDVWMISSAKTTSEVDIEEGESADELRQVEQENRYMYRAFSIMDAFSDELSELKRDRVVGENNDGLLTNLLNVSQVELSDEIREKYKKNSEDRVQERAHRMLENTIKQINIARSYIIEGYILNQKRVKPSYQPDRKQLKEHYKEIYHDAALKGEYIQLDDSKWVSK
ncbi:MAG: hypothetical protein ABUK01_04310 [Leptospirales bacterium]